MQRVTPDRPRFLYDVATTRRIEQTAAAQLPPHTLMQRAGLAVARLALAIAPHARTIWIACGPGNNGGDGLEAAMHLKQWGKEPVITWLGSADRAPADSLASYERARNAGVQFAGHAPAGWDLCIDALLGIGAGRALEGTMLEVVRLINERDVPVLAIDIPTGLNSDTGIGDGVRATHTLGLLALKPGLFTAQGRDRAGEAWFDDLGVDLPAGQACARLAGPPAQRARDHASHKGSYGDVAVIGGAPGMAGAALLAASAALHAGAGRVYVGSLDDRGPAVSAQQPELMFRAWDSLDLASMSVAAGCGGGDAIRGALPKLLSASRALVLDADALNAIAADVQLQALLAARGRRGRPTVLTPHPLEAARMLACDTKQVQSDRLAAARELCTRTRSVVVLKGSGTVMCGPKELPTINATGNGRLATAGTGDVLAGMIAARMAQGQDAFEAARDAVYVHGALADQWPAEEGLTASGLARA